MSGGKAVGSEKIGIFTYAIRKFGGLQDLLERYTFEELESIVRENCTGLDFNEILMCVEETLTELLEDLEDVENVEDVDLEENVEDVESRLDKEIARLLPGGKVKVLEPFVEVEVDPTMLRLEVEKVEDGKLTINLKKSQVIEEVIGIITRYGYIPVITLKST